MKFFIDNWFLFVTALVVRRPAAVADGFARRRRGKVSTSEAVRLINRERAMLLDISDPAEFASGHPAGARNVPLAALEKSDDLPKNKALPVVVVCQTGSRASRGVAILRKLGYENAQPDGRRAGRLARGQSAGREDGLKLHSKPIEPCHPSRSSPPRPARICIHAKQLLRQRGVETLDEIRVDLDPGQRKVMMELSGRRTVPQIFIGDAHVGGCDDLIALDQAGKLLPMLGAD